MVKWVKTTADFMPQDLSDGEFECYSEEDKESVLQTRLFRFRLDQLAVYNEAPNGKATIRMENGYEITTNLTVKELDAMVQSIDNFEHA